mmetsp:Transcript_7927/g.12522  ORF Transcript_7927/g.12522 Transcript_7927/m.12522 type:complete len:143 (+) Transcript_7927:318-746(+)
MDTKSPIIKVPKVEFPANEYQPPAIFTFDAIPLPPMPTMQQLDAFFESRTQWKPMEESDHSRRQREQTFVFYAGPSRTNNSFWNEYFTTSLATQLKKCLLVSSGDVFLKLNGFTSITGTNYSLAITTPLKDGNITTLHLLVG